MNSENNPPPADDPLCGNSVSDLLHFALDSTVPTPHAQPWQAPSPRHLAEMLPQYEVTTLIGRGGMGAVYRGVQRTLKRSVAVKLLPAELAASQEFLTRFQREAQTLAQLQHPGIVSVYDFGQTPEGHLYFIMEFVNGTDLQQIIHGPGLAPNQALELTIQICEALHYAHGQGVIHRDIKPANVLVTQDGRAKLADFGLARPLSPEHGSVTAASLVMGTPDYMAPEQWAGKADHRADIYSLGVMLYEMLTGARPKGVFDLPSQRAKVDARLDEVVIKAMRQEPDRRYQRVSQLREEVEHIRTSGMQRPAVLPEPPLPRLPRGGRKRRAVSHLAAWGLVGGVMLALGVGALSFMRRDGNPPASVSHGSTSMAENSTREEPAPPASAGDLQEPPPPPAGGVEEPVASVVPSTVISPAAMTTAPPPPVPAAPSPTPSSLPVAPPAEGPLPAAPEKPPVIAVFSTQAQNLASWALAPLDETVPPDIRQNLTYLREDLIDEGKTRPAAGLDAYRAAFYLCEALLNALNEREAARVSAGYRAAQAASNEPGTTQALEARRNYMMSWPQYEREQSQRAGLERQAAGRTTLANESQKVSWVTRTERLRAHIDNLYRQFRAAMRG